MDEESPEDFQKRLEMQMSIKGFSEFMEKARKYQEKFVTCHDDWKLISDDWINDHLGLWETETFECQTCRRRIERKQRMR